MACHYSIRRYGEVHWWKGYCVDSHMRVDILKAVELSLDGSRTPLNNELLLRYADCIQDNMTELVKDATEQMKGQFQRIHQVLSLLVLLLVKSHVDQEDLSDIKLRLQALLRNIGSVILSCFNDEMKGSVTLSLSDFTAEVDSINEDINEIMYCIALGTQRQDSLRKFELHLLIILLETLKDLIDSKSDLIMTWKDPSDAVHKNLVLFRSFLQNIKGNSTTTQDGSESILELDYAEKDKQIKTLVKKIRSLRNYIKLEIGLIKSEELSELLVSAQVTAFEMACHYSFTRYGEVHWWKVYVDTKDHVDSHMRVGVIRAAVLSLDNSSTPLSDELLMGYVECIQDNMTELVKDEASDQMRGQFERLNQALSLLVLLLVKHCAGQEKLSHIKLYLQALLRNIGSVIYSLFNDEMKGSVTPLLSDFTRKVDLIKEEVIEIIHCIILGKQEQESIRTFQLHLLIILLEALKDLIDSKFHLIMTSNDQSDAVHKNLVLFRSFLQNVKGNSTTDDGSESVVDLDYCDKDKQIKTLVEKIRLLRKYLQLGVDQINIEELRELLISAQVTAFEMACHYSFTRYGEVHWWKVYVDTKDHLESHMRVGILRAAISSLESSSTLPLRDELLMGYVDCVQENMSELVKDEADDQMKEQFKSIHQELSILALLLIKQCADQETLPDINLRFQALLKNIGSVVCTCFHNRLESNLATEQRSGVADFLEKLNFLKEETQGFKYTVILHRIRQESPKLHLPGFFDLLIDNWKNFIDSESDTFSNKKDQFQVIHETLVIFRSFIQNLTSNPTGDDESQKLCNLIIEAGYVAEYLLDSFTAEACPVSCTSSWISEFTEHIKLIKADIMEVNWRKANDKEISGVRKGPSQVSSQRSMVPKVGGIMDPSHEHSKALVPAQSYEVVGFKVEMKLIQERLYGRKQLDVVSIVGMPGLGKTTLARKVYEDLSTMGHFDVRAWCIVSQEYNKKELFLTILGSKVEVTDLIRRKSETELSVMVHKELKGRRYFIVLDDVWGIDAFMGLKNYFPDDSNGSRIMLTSRSKGIGLQAKYHSDPIELGFLTAEESWDLLERKVFPQGKCPLELCQLGKKIAKKCKGLPLAVVVVAGFIAKSVQKHNLWEQVAENLSSSYLDRDSQAQWMRPLELSYKFLPDLIKPMFLYLGAFPEDKEIPTDKLIWLWIAEGLVQETGCSSLESQAELNLKDLIDRNLVMVSKRSSDGRVKACHIHDL